MLLHDSTSYIQCYESNIKNMKVYITLLINVLRIYIEIVLFTE